MILFNKLFKEKSARDFLIYFSFDGLNKALPFILVPIIANYITTKEYGLVTNFLILFQILYIFVTFNNFTKFSVSFFKIKSQISDYFSNYIYFSIVAFVLLLVIVILGAPILSKYLKLSFTIQISALSTALFAAIVNLYTTLLRMKKKPITFGFLQSSQSIGLFIFTIFLVIFLKKSWEGRVYAQVISSFISVLLCLYFVNKSEGITFGKFDKVKISDTFKWGLPLIPHSLSFWFKSGADKIIITNLLGLSYNGIYSVALTMGGIISLFTTSFFNMYSPLVYEKLTEHENTLLSETKNYIEKGLVKNIYLFVIVLLLLCIISYYIIVVIIKSFFTGDYLLSISLLHLVLIGSFIGGIYSMISVFLFYKNKTKILGTITFSTAIAQIMLTFIFVNLFGVAGALYANIIISSISIILILYYTNKIYHLPWFDFFR